MSREFILMIQEDLNNPVGKWENIQEEISLLSSTDNNSETSSSLILTNKNLIKTIVNRHKIDTQIVPLNEITGFSISTINQKSLVGILWALLSIIVAVAIWQVWDNSLPSTIVAFLICGMGLYIFAERYFLGNHTLAIFQTQSQNISIELSDEFIGPQITSLADKLFKSKTKLNDQRHDPNNFAPR